MGYRFNDTPPNPEDHLMKLHVRNGATLRAAFGCYYLNTHDRKFHDHIGWPYPGHPDHICQIPYDIPFYGDKSKTMELDEIHLTAEGYNNVFIKFEDSELEYINANAYIDEQDDHIVRIQATTCLPLSLFENNQCKDFVFTLFAQKAEPETYIIDAIFHGVISVMPGAPWGENDIDNE